MYIGTRAATLIGHTTQACGVAVSESDDLAEALELRMKQLSADAQTLQSMDVRNVHAPPRATDSFSSADDDDIAAALARRVEGDDVEPIDDQAPLTGAGSPMQKLSMACSKQAKHVPTLNPFQEVR